eukprot:10776312-Prorocentrum_lima.AAC.1
MPTGNDEGFQRRDGTRVRLAFRWSFGAFGAFRGFSAVAQGKRRAQNHARYALNIPRVRGAGAGANGEAFNS